MGLTNQDLDSFIDTAIMRLSGQQGQLISHFYVDLRVYQQRITQNLINECVNLCHSRGLITQRNGDGLTVSVDLNSCLLNSYQANNFRIALAYTQGEHGNQL